ncbi:hypothetical protein PFTANZ_00240 [Plasmodium falciparum Tanzania (2000708)]|uniref:TFIIS-type domain-containing protein n=1 Tax=Plasmodium falciparum Tanzania (2000708) TaxID=1036725 RepID=A0A024WE89_PLAFA|nr:hypothetical protein PFTANZ_00240 [Plasmodium falciparum Tanzania (2000708)]
MTNKVIGGMASGMTNNVTTVCPKCTNDEAYFYTLQIRSADEPSTIFYICVKCNYHWKE